MKIWLLITGMLLGCVLTANADHITGGEIHYKFVGISNGVILYDVSARIFMRCGSGRQFQNPAIFSIFNSNSKSRYRDYDVLLDHQETISETSSDPCITNPPTVCYNVGYYEFTISVPTSGSYTIAHQVMFRIDGISNLVSNYDQVGATYISEIPNVQNNSAHFIGSDLVTICASNAFTYSFAAEDEDGDELHYSFCNALRSAESGGTGGRDEPPPSPPYESVPYGQGFTGTVPLGGNVSIDPNTGLITGIAPVAGKYVVTVCVQETRDGKVIATQHKDLQINITTCTVTGATLPPEYMLCGSTMTLTPKNLSTSPLISTFNWDFFDSKGNNLYTSNASEPSFTFADTGLYQVRLIINRDQACVDSSSSLVRVYPGFNPDFSVSGPCIIRSTQFNDATTSLLGAVSSWTWDFGDATSSTDNSADRNPSYQYPVTGDKEVSLVAENTLGCRDTVSKLINIFDKPPIGLAFKDTLICPPDNIQLSASGRGVYTWTPAGGVSDAASANPFVSPSSTTTYYIDLVDDGCVNRDSVTVRVVDHVTLTLGNDLKICEGDTIHLQSNTDGTRFLWSPAATLDNSTTQNVVATPVGTTTYQLTAFISNCSASGDITVTPIPYPVANAGTDTLICFNTSAVLHGTSNGSSFLWAPRLGLDNDVTLNAVASPKSNTTYVLYAYDTRGCDKPGTDTVVVNVQPEIIAFAGNDTSVVINQPVQLRASGGLFYQWIPSTGLSASNIENPVALYTETPAEGNYTYKVLISNQAGCIDSANVTVSIFSTTPEIYVPNAFTPNGDGHNDYFKLVAPGIETVNFFRVFNRWGQIVYESPLSHGLGWDGRYNGKPLASGTFVWIVQGVDYTGRTLVRKGTVALIR